jgi:hypothetical protein
MFIGAAAVVLAGMLVACESDAGGPRPQRAVRIDDDTMSPGSEAMGPVGGANDTVPLVTVDMPNNPKEPVVVRTIVQNVQETFNPPATQPVATPTTKPQVDPIFGR